MTAGTRVFYASTLFGALSLAAGIDAGLFGDGGRRVLIVSSNVPVPEVTPGFDEAPAFAAIRSRWQDVVRWNDLIAPLHPSGWTPPVAEEPLLGRWLLGELGLSEPPAELVVESIAVAPARTIAALLRPCPVTVYADGLMSYGPTRDALPRSVAGRVTRLVHPDLVPGLTPLLLREYDVATVHLPGPAFTAAVAALPAPDVGEAAGAPVIVGQYLSQLGVLDAAGETALHARMVNALAARGEDRIVFRPHPAARRDHVPALLRHAASRGIELIVPDDGLPAEAWFAAARPSTVVSCFSTALFTARHHYGADAVTMGTDLVLEGLTPYENSNRIPATIADAAVSRLLADGNTTAPSHDAAGVRELVSAVGYCMQAGRLPDLRAAAVDYLGAHGPARYFKRKRIDALNLGGAVPPPEPAPAPPAAARLSRLLRRVVT